jgi:hypothetical protein
VTFGELAAAAGRQPMPDKVPLKAPSAFRLVGRPLHRIDAAAKTDGSARFGIDALPPNLLYASVLMCPTVGGRVKHADVSAPLARRGVVKAFVVPPFDGGTGGVAVIADNAFRAMQALDALKVDWDPGPAAGGMDVLQQEVQLTRGFHVHDHDFAAGLGKRLPVLLRLVDHEVRLEGQGALLSGRRDRVGSVRYAWNKGAVHHVPLHPVRAGRFQISQLLTQARLITVEHGRNDLESAGFHLANAKGHR